MVNRDEIEEEVREDLEVIESGSWYIAEASYDGLESVAQGESRQEAVGNLIDRFYKRARREEEMERERERITEEMERRRELADERMERAVEQAEREFEHLKERFDME